MRFLHALTSITLQLGIATSISIPGLPQTPVLQHASTSRNISIALFEDLEEFARIVDISYCVGLTSLGINKPFQCLSRCSEFPDFELVKTWNTGPMLSDSCGYVALDHKKERIIAAFRGTSSIANTIVDLSTVPQDYVPFDGSDDGDDKDQPKCNNCTVHTGFHSAWLNTRDEILDDLREEVFSYPQYKLHLVGHSLGGAVAALAALDVQARGWDPVVTTFGEPRIGNVGLVKFLDERFDLTSTGDTKSDDMKLKYRRVTHIDDPVPLLPLSEWTFVMHAGEIYISKSGASPDILDLEHCEGDNDQECIAGQDSTTTSDSPDTTAARKRDLLSSVEDEVQDLVHEPWGIPTRYKLWELFTAHRDYFWTLGLCVPPSDPASRGGEKYEDGRKEDLR